MTQLGRKAEGGYEGEQEGENRTVFSFVFFKVCPACLCACSSAKMFDPTTL